MKKLIFASLLCLMPLSLSAEQKGLEKYERDILFREANLAIIKYHYHLDLADHHAIILVRNLELDAWKTAYKVAAAAALTPADITGKAIASLIVIMDSLVEFIMTAGEPGYKYDANLIDYHLAKAAAWWSTYEKAQTRLLMDE